MSLLKNAGTIAFLCAIQIGAMTHAHAFQLQDPAQEAYSARSIAAFAVETGSNSDLDSFTLSQTQIDHIRWCAANHRSYNPTDDTYSDTSGAVVRCLSPN